MSEILRLLVSLWIMVVLVRSARNAWARRDLLALVWRGINLGVLAKAFALLVATLATASVLLQVPLLQYGLGDLVNFQGNAVFTPLEQAAGALGPAPAVGPDWALIALATVFLGALLLLLPWLAFIEEEVFRAGLESQDGKGQIYQALRFGLVHLIMLVPLAAALAIAVAGYGYGRIYLRALRQCEPELAPMAAVLAFRPTRRSRQASADQWSLADPGTLVTTVERRVERCQATAVVAAACAHTAFNATVLTLVWIAIVLPAFQS
jgi:hypothetical protein